MVPEMNKTVDQLEIKNFQIYLMTGGILKENLRHCIKLIQSELSLC